MFLWLLSSVDHLLYNAVLLFTIPSSSSSSRVSIATACPTLTKFVQDVADSRYDNDLHTRTHCLLSGSDHPHRCWQHDWSRDQCVTLAQLRTGYSPLLASFLLRIGQQSSAMCPHCNVTEETAEHLLLRCPSLVLSLIHI